MAFLSLCPSWAKPGSTHCSPVVSTGKRQRTPGALCCVCFIDVVRQHEQTFPTCAESSKEASQRQDKA